MSKQRQVRRPKKPISIDSNSENAEVLQVQDDFERELCWCIQQLRLGLANKHANAKQVAENTRVLKILKNNNGALVKKRQVMRGTFGDYRSKMKQEEKQFGIHKKASMKAVSDKQKRSCTFIKKAVKPTQVNKAPHSTADIDPGFTFKESREKFQFHFNSVSADSPKKTPMSLEDIQVHSGPNEGLLPGTEGSASGQFKFNFCVQDSDQSGGSGLEPISVGNSVNYVTSHGDSSMTEPQNAFNSVDEVASNGDSAMTGLSDGLTAMAIVGNDGLGSQTTDSAGAHDQFSWNNSSHADAFSFNFKIDGAS